MLAFLFACVASSLMGCKDATAEEHLQRALDYQGKGQPNAAIIELKNALQKNPQLGEARLALGELDLALGNLDDALSQLERALDLGVAKDRVLPPLLETKLDLGHAQEVLGALETAGPLSPRLQAIRGEALLATGDLAAAKTDFDAAIAQDPTLPRAYSGLARVALAGTVPDADTAVAMLTKGTAAVPSNRRLWMQLGELELNLGHAEPAVNAWEKAKALPGGDLLPEIGLVRAHLLQNDVSGAEKILDDVLTRAPKNPLALHLKGVIALYQHDVEGAARALQSALAAAPDFPPSLLALATVKHQQGQSNQAEALLRRYIALVPDGLAARKALAAELLAGDRPADAIDALSPMAAQLTDGQDLALLGTAYLRAQRFNEAAHYLALAAEALPNSPQLKTQVALGLAAAGDNAGALARLDEIVPAPESATQNEVLKVLLNLRNGNTDAALAGANGLVESTSHSALAYNILGVVQVARKDSAAARAAFDAALKADPKFGGAAVNLAKLDLQEGKPADARKRLEDVVAASPGDQSALLALAQLTLAAGDTDKAASYLEQARQADAKALQPRIALARLALARGDLKTADAVSAEAEAIRPDVVDVLVVRAQVAAVSHNGAALMHDLDALATATAKRPISDPGLALQIGELERQAGRAAEARQHLLIALENTRFEQPALIALVQVETAANQPAAARGYLDRLKKTNVSAAVVDELDGDLAFAAGELDAAAAHYEKAAAAESRGAVTKLAITRERQGKPAAGIATLEAWLKKHPGDDSAALVLATMRIHAGDFANARKEYEALLPRYADDPVFVNNLAWLYFDAKDPRAEALARKAHAAASDNPDVTDTLGWILANSEKPGAVTEAVELLEKSAAQHETPSVLYHLAVAQQKAGRTREARETVTKALKSEQFPERAKAEALAKTVSS